MRAWLAVLALAACSQEGGGLPVGASPDLGLFPLAEQAISFCHSGAQVVVSGKVGFCVPAAAAARACSACGAREVCTCGRCTLEACASASDCAAGVLCRNGRCEVSLGGCEDCRPGERCRDGVCQAAPCQADDDCEVGERCDLVREPMRLGDPSVAAAPDGLWMALEERLSTGVRIWLARAADGARFELEASPALEAVAAWERGSVGAPALAADLTLYYEVGDAEGIGRARRDASGVFVREAGPLLAPREGFEEGRVGGPAPLGDALFYDAGRAIAASGAVCADDAACGNPLERCRAGVCRSVPRLVAVARGLVRTPLFDGAAVTAGAALRTTGEPLWAGVQAVFAPAAIEVPTAFGERLTLLFFAGVGTERPSLGPNRSIGLAVSRNGVEFSPYAYNPVAARVALYTVALGESGPAPLWADEKLSLYFEASGRGGSAALPSRVVSAPAP